MAKRKKMTLQEFKDALDNVAGLNFKIFGWEGILNLIACEACYAAKEDEKMGLNHLAESEWKRNQDIIAFLAGKGYYNN